MNDLRLRRIFERAALCRAFENECFRRIKSGAIKIPTYLSAGQEYIPATLSVCLEEWGIKDLQIFIQHRGHSQYLCFGGDMDALVLELLGDARGCAGGMGGSASIQSIQANIFGHDGLMGTQVPIAVGACYANRKPTIVFMGDAAAEEDYVLAAFGWAATKRLPILFVVEDNDLAILTEKQVRRSWNIAKVVGAFGIEAHDIEDDPTRIERALCDVAAVKELALPVMLNVHTTRLFWHAGAGQDDGLKFDRHRSLAQHVGYHAAHINQAARDKVKEVWQRHCGT